MDDQEIAHKYVLKIGYCKQSNTVFNLSFYEYKRLITSKRCKYTGVELTAHEKGKLKATDVTIDRIDNNIGYVTGNVVACCHAYNNFKCAIENPNNLLDFKTIERALNIQKNLQGGF